MQTTGFQEAIETLTREDKRYHPEAYAFLRDSLEATIKRRKKSRKDAGPHVGAAELLDGFRLHALNEFGPMALMVLDYWGVQTTADVGHMVFNLVQAGVFGKTDEDTPESFRDVFDFQEAFADPFRPSAAPLNENGTPGV
ncbi:MAG: Minf_1886 family protein [Terrimicrobiaceae bacterium]|jgi:uncharacterized repeat protein (TIGR04138 family)